MKTLILYHRDMDGLASALIARKKYPDAHIESVQYGDKIDCTWFAWHRIILVDFSFDKETMGELKENSEEFIWIDHHRTAAESPLWRRKYIKGKRSVKKAACELTWEYFFSGEECPYAIKLIGDRDMWKFKYDYQTKNLHTYFETFDINEKHDIEIIDDIIFDCAKFHELKQFINAGRNMSLYKNALIKKIYEKGTVKEEFGHMAFMCMSPVLISEVADYAIKHNSEIEIAVIWQYKYVDNKPTTIISLRSRGNVDVSEIAKKNGGGGHHDAAGYVYKKKSFFKRLLNI